MKQINLIPANVRQKAASRHAIPYMVLAGILGLVAAGAAWAGFSLQVRSLKADKDNLIQLEAERQKAASADLTDLNVDADLTSRVSTLNTLAKTDINWNKAFAYVASIVPKDITLDGYSFGTAAGVVTLKLTGEAPSNVSYATYAKYMEQSVGTIVTTYHGDGYTYEPATGKVTFSMTITVPSTAVAFPKS